MIASGDLDAIITKVIPGMDPLQDFQDDDPENLIVIDYITDDEDDVGNLSEVSMMSAGGISREELRGLLSDIVVVHQELTRATDTLAAHMNNMSPEQTEEVAAVVTSKLGHVRNLDEVTSVFDIKQTQL